jgi:hypothetical protein
MSKCSFAQITMSYLGYVISEQEVATCPDKIKAVAEWSQPQNVKELRSFLGLAGYYRKFVKHFGLTAKPLTESLKKGYVFQWTQEKEVSFQTLKKALVEAPVPALPDFSYPFCIEIDASRLGVGAVLMQRKHPIPLSARHLVQISGVSPHMRKSILLFYLLLINISPTHITVSSIYTLTRRAWCI